MCSKEENQIPTIGMPLWWFGHAFLFLRQKCNHTKMIIKQWKIHMPPKVWQTRSDFQPFFFRAQIRNPKVARALSIGQELTIVWRAVKLMWVAKRRRPIRTNWVYGWGDDRGLYAHERLINTGRRIISTEKVTISRLGLRHRSPHC